MRYRGKTDRNLNAKILDFLSVACFPIPRHFCLAGPAHCPARRAVILLLIPLAVRNGLAIMSLFILSLTCLVILVFIVTVPGAFLRGAGHKTRPGMSNQVPASFAFLTQSQKVLLGTPSCSQMSLVLVLAFFIWKAATLTEFLECCSPDLLTLFSSCLCLVTLFCNSGHGDC